MNKIKKITNSFSLTFNLDQDTKLWELNLGAQISITTYLLYIYNSLSPLYIKIILITIICTGVTQSIASLLINKVVRKIVNMVASIVYFIGFVVSVFSLSHFNEYVYKSGLIHVYISFYLFKTVYTFYCYYRGFHNTKFK